MNILVVDDEMNVRNSIINIISQNIMYDVNILQAESAEEAWEILNNHDVSLLISDIIMSGMTGIELAKKAREADVDCEIIFISAYDHKEYLKAAIELDSIGYIDKPIDKTKLLAILKDVFKKKEQNIGIQEQEETALQTELVNLLISSQNGHNKTGVLLEKLYGKNADKLNFVFAICKFSYKADDDSQYIALEKKFKVDDESVKLIFSRKNRNTYVLVFMSENREGLFEYAHQKMLDINTLFYPKMRLLISLSTVADSIIDIHKAYEEAVCRIESGFYTNYGIVDKVALQDSESLEIIKIIDDFNKVLDTMGRTAILDFLEQLYVQIKELKNLPSNLTVFLFKNLIYQMHLHFYNKLELEYNKKYEQIENDEFLIFDELYEYAVSEAEDLFEAVKFDDVVSKIKSCIKKLHVNPEVTLQDISAELNLSIGHICKRFKRSTGMSVNNYLNHVRIEHAKELLKQGNYSSEQITYMVGYADPNYFSRSFKKNTGMTVSEYRKNIKNEDR